MKTRFFLLTFLFLTNTQASQLSRCMDTCRTNTISQLGRSITIEELGQINNYCAQRDCVEIFEAKQREAEAIVEMNAKLSTWGDKTKREMDQRDCINKTAPFSEWLCYIYANTNGY